MSNRDPIGFAGVLDRFRTCDDARLWWRERGRRAQRCGYSYPGNEFQGDDIGFRSAGDLFGHREEPGGQKPRIEGIANRDGPSLMEVVKTVGADASPIVNR